MSKLVIHPQSKSKESSCTGRNTRKIGCAIAYGADDQAVVGSIIEQELPPDLGRGGGAKKEPQVQGVPVKSDDRLQRTAGQRAGQNRNARR